MDLRLRVGEAAEDVVGPRGERGSRLGRPDTPRDDRTSRRVPVSRSSFASCCDTAEGVYDSARAAPEMEPARTTSRRTLSLVTSSM